MNEKIQEKTQKENYEKIQEEAYREEENVLYCGDNLEIMRKYIPSESVDLCYIDPPFAQEGIIKWAAKLRLPINGHGTQKLRKRTKKLSKIRI